MAVDYLLLTGKWVYAFYILAIYSYFLYKETPFYRFAEYSAIATALANYVVASGLYVYNSTWIPLTKGEIIQIVPLIIGITVLLRLVKGYTWAGKPAMGVLVGVGAGLAMRTVILTNFVDQIKLIAIPLIGGRITPIDNLILVIFPLCVLGYFLFSREHTGTMRYVAMAGRYAMMITFGGLFGTGVVYRITWMSAQILIVMRTFGLVP